MTDEELSFEQAREELQKIVAHLDSGDVSLQESLELWQRGEKLVARCEQILTSAQQMIDAARAQAEPPT